MAEEGLNLTKDIMAYDEDITAVMNQYRIDISQAKTNIGKLEAIKKEVSNIIKAAQDRRDANLVKILEEETKRKCLVESDDCMNRINVPSEVNQDDLGEYCLAKRIACEKDIMTEAEYKTEYAMCLDEEDILYYDESDIMNDSVGERCNNNLDDDLDGLIDGRDPDCSGGITPPTDNKHCVMGQYTTNDLNYPANKACKDRVTSAECLNSDYYYGTLANVCDWTTGPGITPPLVSLYGCTIKAGVVKPSMSPANQHCLLRTEEKCTFNDYVNENNQSYKCEFRPI